ncbi:MAG: sensor histidine kinase [Atopobiaceae bacterium]|jgi:signal transduction histidine kinase
MPKVGSRNLHTHHDQRDSLQKRIFWKLAVASVVSGLTITLALTAVFHQTLLEDAKTQLAEDLVLVSTSVSEDADTPSELVEDLSSIRFSRERATLIAADGTVLYDSTVDADTLPNHAERPEVQQALTKGSGSSIRPSNSVGNVSIYQSLRLDDGSVLRLSEDRASIMALLSRSFLWVILALVVLLGMSWLISRRLARNLVNPILLIDPSDPGEAPYRELDPLLHHLRSQQRQLEEQMEELKSADTMRREFTANVTHELKTPIASISGAAELIRDGIVRPEDVSDFGRRIYNEAQRLSALVSDILTLSRLDESERSRTTDLFGEPQLLDLCQVAKDALGRSLDRARKARIRMEYPTETALVLGHARLIDELVGNLISNAIRYNKEGGSVRVTTGAAPGGGAFIEVADTGVGIPEEAQSKVFERFYRVHKSRSRESGGTGLGLAIVKHAARIHGATIKLTSKLGEGTTIRVEFPPVKSGAISSADM